MLNRALQTFLARTPGGAPIRFKVERYGRTEYPQGERKDQAPEVFTFEGVIAPVTGDDMQSLPEGCSVNNTRRVFCERELRTGDRHEPDVITIDGEPYTVVSVTKWPGIHPDPPFFEAFAARDQEVEE